jgi:hypothetical protein
MTITERVSAGAAALDEVRPAWRSGIDPDALDVTSLWTCPLGQTFGTFGQGVKALLDLGEDDSIVTDGIADWAVAHGFDVGEDEDVDDVTRAWVAEAQR